MYFSTYMCLSLNTWETPSGPNTDYTAGNAGTKLVKIVLSRLVTWHTLVYTGAGITPPYQ